MKTWLVLDCHYLCHRAFHSSQTLAWKGQSTGVIFGFLQSIMFLKDEFQTDRVVFCFDHPHLFRRDVYPAYKRKRVRKEYTAEERKSYEAFAIQITELRKRYLPQIGFRNVLSVRGMESDDIMASIAFHTPKRDDVILVTADADLYQCLGPNVRIYTPQSRKLLTDHWFVAKYGILPRKWPMVKAIAGCSSDGVQGIRGVGELTALRYLRGELKESSNAYQAIRSRSNRAIVRRNKDLVRLPYKGCPVFDLVGDNVTKEAWLEVCDMLGMRSLASRPPVATRKGRSYVKGA